MPLTRTSGPSSRASDLVSMTSPALAAEYTGCALSGRRPWMSTMLMISPRDVAQRRGRRLRQEQRCAQVGADQVVELRSVIVPTGVG